MATGNATRGTNKGIKTSDSKAKKSVAPQSKASHANKHEKSLDSLPNYTASNRSQMKKTSSQTSKPKDFTGIGYLGIPPYQEKKDEEYMNIEQREHFRKILLSWKQSLMEEVDVTKMHMQDDANNFADFNDRASQEEELTKELRARDRGRKLIKKIEEALDRIQHNDYGFCDACGIEIGIRRLEARPTATLCIDCKTLDEIREKQISGG